MAAPGLLALGLLGGGSAGCGDDGSSGGADAATPDGSLGRDARVTDGAPADGRPGADAGVDAAPADGAVRTDAATPDAALPGTCSLHGPAELFRDSEGGGLELAAAGGPDGFLIAWTVFVDGAQALFARWVSGTGETGTEQRLTGEGLPRQPAVVWADGGWLLAWSESASGALDEFEVVTRRLEADGTPAGSHLPVTDNALEDAAPSLLRVGDAVLAAWVEQSVTAGTPPRLVGQRLRASGEPIGAALSLAPATAVPSVPRLAGRPEGAVVAWLDRMSDRREVRLQKLSRTGVPEGEPHAVSTHGKVFASLDATEGGQGGLVVFDVSTSPARRDVQARPYREDGMPTGSERLLSGGALPGRSPSVAPLAGGFAVLWRTSARLRRQLRLVLLDTDAHVILAQRLTSLVDTSGPVRIRASTGGLLLATWVDRAADGATVLRAGRVHCGR